MERAFTKDPLNPNCPSWRPDGAIPPTVRKFARFFDTSNWWPGDLILTKDLNPDWFTRQIKQFQILGGYSDADAEWTHAALYVGDSLSVCEANILDWRFWRGCVMVSDLYSYCGGHEIRVRRSNHITSPELGWRMAIEALVQLNKPYDMQRIIDFAKGIAKKRGFWSANSLTACSDNRAVICSTLYADVHNKVTKVTIGERSGICLPAYLSNSDQFKDVPTNWLSLAS